MIVVDASVVLAWTLPGEVRFEGARRLVGHGLVLAERRGRASREIVDAALTELSLLRVSTDPQTQEQAWSRAVEVARKHRLTVYDAAHVELALREGAAVASFDTALARAAAAEGLTVLTT